MMPTVSTLQQAMDALVDRGYAVWPGFLDAAAVAGLLAEARARREAGAFHRAGVGRANGLAVRDQVRGDEVLWLDEAADVAAERPYWQALQALRREINQTLYLGLVEGEFHYAHYPVGTFYRRHLDRFRDDDARTVSCVLYLNQDWQDAEGGQLRLYLDATEESKFLDVSPQAGTLALFLSDRFWHEVLPASRERWSVTGWMRRRV